MKYSVLEIREYPLEQILKEKKFSVRKFATLAGIEYTHVFRLIKGQYAASPSTMQKILAAVAKIHKL